MIVHNVQYCSRLFVRNLLFFPTNHGFRGSLHLIADRAQPRPIDPRIRLSRQRSRDGSRPSQPQIVVVLKIDAIALSLCQCLRFP